MAINYHGINGGKTCLTAGTESRNLNDLALVPSSVDLVFISAYDVAQKKSKLSGLALNLSLIKFR